MTAGERQIMPQKPKEDFFKSFDGTSISYRVSGKGEKTLLCFNGIGVAKWAWLPLEDYFKDRFRIVTWDYRGHGLSETPKRPNEATFGDIVDDAFELIKKLRIKNAHFLGHSSGFHVALEVYREKPKIVKGLISCLGTHGHSLEHFMDSFLGHLVFDIGYILNAVLPETSHWLNTNLLANPVTYQLGALLRLTNPAIAGKTEVTKYLEHFSKIDFSLFNHLIVTESEQSSDDLLPKIKVPTFLIAAEHDLFIPHRIAKTIHSKVPKSKLFTIKNGTHAALFEQPDVFNLLIEKFLVIAQ